MITITINVTEKNIVEIISLRVTIRRSALTQHSNINSQTDSILLTQHSNINSQTESILLTQHSNINS